MMTMRRARMVVIAGLVLKVAVLGAWWRAGLAQAERHGEEAGAGEEVKAGIPAELFRKSRGFQELLQAVEQRGAELERREQAVAEREAALKALEAALGEQVVRIDPSAAAEPSAPAAAAGGAPAPEPAAGRCGVVVTKIYQSMKPEEAAGIFDRLDDTTAKMIFACMKERQIGAILAAMNKDRAVALTRALAGS